MAAVEHSHNLLLQRPELGRTTRRGDDLPGDNFTYGISTISVRGDKGGAGKAISSWQSVEGIQGQGKRPKLHRSKTMDIQDFMALNKAATRKGLHTSQEFSKFRSTHSMPKTVSGLSANPGVAGAEVARIDPFQVYGQPTRPTTPIYDLIEHGYQRKWLEHRRDQDMAARAMSNYSKAGVQGIYETRASLLRKYLPKIENHEVWQIAKFKNVGPHVSSFRSENARKSALENHELDGACRLGYLSQGGYATPPY